MGITYAERADLLQEELQDLFASAWAGTGKSGYDEVLARSFSWISVHDGCRLVGFVNTAWDGGVHFFMLEITVHPEYRRRGIGNTLVRRAIEACRGRGEWLHVDSDDELMTRLYFPAGFMPANAGHCQRPQIAQLSTPSAHTAGSGPRLPLSLIAGSAYRLIGPSHLRSVVVVRGDWKRATVQLIVSVHERLRAAARGVQP